jgi:hypothetical protein
VLLDGWLASTIDDSVTALGQQGDPPAAAIALARRHHDAVREISRAMIFAPLPLAGN